MMLLDKHKQMINPKLSIIKRMLKNSIERELRIIITKDCDYVVGDAYYWDHCALAGLITRADDYVLGWFVETPRGISYKEDSEESLCAEQVLNKLGFNYKTGFLKS